MEVAAAALITSVLLIPSLALLDDSQAFSQRLDHRNELVFAAEDRLEDRKAELSQRIPFDRAYAQPAPTLQTGTFSLTAGQRGRFRLTTEVDPAYPASSPVLRLQIQAWHDRDDDGQFDRDETEMTLRTKLCRPRA